MTPARTAALIFDLDDTLIDTSVVFARLREEFTALMVEHSFDAEAVKLCYELVDSENLKIYGYVSERNLLSMRETYEKLTLSAGIPFSASVLRKIADIGRHCLYQIPRPMHYCKPLLAWCSARCMLGLITRGSEALQNAKLDALDIRKYFSAIKIANEKTTDSFAAILERIGSKPGNAVSIGDSLRFDILPACTIGMKAIHVRYPLQGIQWMHDWISESALSSYYFASANNLWEVQELLTPMIGS